MNRRAEYLTQADECRKWSERAKGDDTRARWLDLAGKWLRLADSVSEPVPFNPVVYEGDASRKASGNS